MWRIYCKGWCSGEPYTVYFEFQSLNAEALERYEEECQSGEDPDGNQWQTVDLLEVVATLNRLVND